MQHRRVIAALRAVDGAQEIAPRTADEQSQTVHTGLQMPVQAVAVVNEGRVTTRCACRIADGSEIDAKGALPRPTVIDDPHTFVDNADACAIITDIGEVCVLDIATAQADHRAFIHRPRSLNDTSRLCTQGERKENEESE